MNPRPDPAFVNALARNFSGELRFDAYARALFATDASPYQITPLGVAFPRTLDDLQCAVQVCAEHAVPLVPRGAGSGLAGGALGRGLVLDCSRHLTQFEIEPEAGRAWVEAGVVCDTLNAAAARHGLRYPCAPSSSNRATFGGILGNNATGAHSVRFGMSADQLLAADVILADGRRVTLAPGQAPADLETAVNAIAARHADAIRAAFPRTWRRASGYGLNYLLPPHGFSASRPAGWEGRPYPDAGPEHLHRLLAGAEGTLAVLGRAQIALAPRPAFSGLCILQFETITQAAGATPAILEARPAAIELMDRGLLTLARSRPAFARLLDWAPGDPGAVLAVEFDGASEAEVLAQIMALEARRLAPASTRALPPAAQNRVWAVRKVGLGILLSTRGDAKPTAFVEDVAVPVEQLAGFLDDLARIFAAEGVSATCYGHASAGCLHLRPVLNLKTAEGVRQMARIAAAVLAAVRARGGALSGEHGDGLARSVWNEALFGAEVYQAFREVKQAFDPRGLLNPGKVIADQGLTDNLRYGPAYHAQSLTTRLDFTPEGGIAGAVEQCNGSGECRQAGGGMCPSFQATRDEEHSPRGRANALRAALSGLLPADALTSPRLRAVLDLCLECKACKRECPSGVDVAKLKYDYLARYQAEHGMPLRSQFFGHLPAILRLAQPAAPLVNALLARPAVRGLNEKLLGIAPQRALPQLAPRTFRSTFQPADDGRPVLLFVDTYTDLLAPEIGHAAVKVLRAAGYAPQVVPHGCCGRPLISKGLLDEARANARRTVASLAHYAAQGLPIVGLEPSCLLTFRDEYLDLLPRDPGARRLADQSLLIEEFIAGRPAEFAPLLAGGVPAPVLVHGHCYQQALTGTEPLLTMLRLAGAEAQLIDAGCCGMAGAFGYEAEHYALSMKIGEDRLFPAVRAAPPESVLAAAGVSCRAQILAGAGRPARHPVEILADRLRPVRF